MLVAAAIGGTFYFRSRQTTTGLTDKDTIVLSDFDNKTGDSVFDDTLKQGLSVQLEQSPFLALVSDRKVNETLKLMGRPAGDRLTPEVTREVCERTGTKAMLTILERICAGSGQPGDLDYLEQLGQQVRRASLCGLGQTAPNPVLSTLRYFRDEYEAHIVAKTCPARVCKGLISYSVIAERCTGCMVCLRNCPGNAITGGKKQVHGIDA